MEVLQTPNPFPVPETDPLTYGQRLRAVWEHCQRGLVYTAPYAIFSTFWTHKALTRERLSNLMNKVRHHIHKEDDLRQRHTTAILGVSFLMWSEISKQEGLPLPKGMALKNPQAKNPHSTEAFPYSHGKFMDSGADLWFHIKSHDEAACAKVLAFIVEELKSETKTHVAQPAASTSNERGDNQGKVLGCRFSENLNNPSDPISLAKHTLVGGEDMSHFGGSFVLAQRFMINWSQIHSMSEEQIEDLIGRKTDDTIIPSRDARSHIILSRIQDEHGNTTPILRLGLPFGKAKKTQASDKAPKGITSADENGIYYAGFSKNAAVLEKVMMNQIGSVPEFMNDRLMNHIRSDLGGIYYIPSADDLKLVMNNDFSHVEKGDWSRFPGVDWNRIIRHYRIASDNGLMYYNHQHFLFAMATGIDRKNHYFKTPSPRILSLLEMTFRLWQDNWYFNRKQEEIPYDLSHYVNEYQGADKPADVMKESIMVRKGWAIRMSLNLFTSRTYGFRGRRILINGELKPYSAYDEERGKVICGSGTYHISPEEIIVGAMPNLTLGEGRYVMRYLTEQERQDGFINNLSEASGVGHVIPNFEKALEKGLKGLMEEVKAYESKTQDQTKRDVYTSSYLALQGISEYCLNYASLAKEMAQKMSEDQHWERHNLTEIAKRMIKLSTDKPDTFVEALQLIFIIHCSLHLNGEPTALGRLDQLLYPFYKRGHVTEYEAQEAIEAFYIKLDEKVQQNRLYMEDHQPFGNLAMGGSSGVYPQAASLGQWIQQLTVGGTVANGETPSKPAYNDVTRMFIRASGKLPLNAPCLSLRTRKDIPEDLLKEAAHAILSGGAHPILLNDEMLIPGLQTSGDGVGGDLSEDVKKKWNSKVSLKSAQNYACDGCYEPQFPGENWFSLGGFSTLQPLECAINQGKSYAAAGQAYLNGKRVSVRTKPADEIKSFDELMDLYYEHFDWLNRKAFTGQVMGFGANTAYCPSPILNVFMDDCLAKGQDFYAGGARYNVYGPCYISLSTTINSLYAIKMMVFDEKNAVTTLEELRECLCCDWGYFMSEPFISRLAGEGRIAARSDRFKRLRQFALSLPKYGRGHPEIDTFGNKVVERIGTLSIEAFTKPWPQFKANMELKANAYGTPDHKFGFQIQPGVGTFENHVEMGAWNGASADGRRNGTTVASDLSASPSPADLPIDHQIADFPGSLKGFESKGTAMYSDGAPTDYNIQENYPPEKLAEVLKQFAQGESSNILTVTVANPDTFTKAVDSPEQYDLLRVRTGGWSTFFTSVFPVIQEQHRRRPVSVPEKNDVVTETKKSGCPFHHK